MSGGIFLWGKYNKSQLSKKTTNYISELNNQPGLLITNHSIDSKNKITIYGLKDNFAKVPKPSSQWIEDQVKFKWKPYFSTEKSILTKRIASQLNLPKNIELKLLNGELHISGKTTKKLQNKLIDTVNFYLDNTQVKFSTLKKNEAKGG